MRIMGLDVGEKRIGIALSDPLGWTAQGYSVLERKGNQADMDYLQKVCRENEVNKIVMGLPLNMDGSAGPKVREIRDFAARVKKALGLPVEFWDERLTTREAERILLEADMSRARRKKVVDKLAAVTILQSYLDRNSGSQSR